MAEFVEKALEELLPVFEQIKLVQLFTPEEVCEFIKDCRNFEYKLCKQVFLYYIISDWRFDFFCSDIWF